MRKLLLIPLFLILACNKDETPPPAPPAASSALGDALSHLGMRWLDFYELIDPTDSQTLLFRLEHDSVLYEFKNNYSSKTTCRFWVTGSGADLTLNITAVPGSFQVENDPNNGLGDTVMAYYFVNRLAATDTLRITKDNSGQRRLSATGYDVPFDKWEP